MKFWEKKEVRMNKVKFTQEWDKLKPGNFKVGRLFTTFRAYNPQKDRYYSENLGEKFEIELNGDVLGIGILRLIQYVWSDELDLKTIKRDTYSNYDYEDWQALIERFYGKEKVFGILLTFEIIAVYQKKTLEEKGGETCLNRY